MTNEAEEEEANASDNEEEALLRAQIRAKYTQQHGLTIRDAVVYLRTYILPLPGGTTTVHDVCQTMPLDTDVPAWQPRVRAQLTALHMLCLSHAVHGSPFQRALVRSAARPPWPPLVAMAGWKMGEAIVAWETMLGARLAVAYVCPDKKQLALVFEWIDAVAPMVLVVLCHAAVPPGNGISVIERAELLAPPRRHPTEAPRSNEATEHDAAALFAADAQLCYVTSAFADALLAQPWTQG